MSNFRIALLTLGLSFGYMTSGSAAVMNDYDFEQERMELTSTNVFIVSSFDSEDHLSSYTRNGSLEWNKIYATKIISWKVEGYYIYVYSKSRKGNKTYLRCLNKYDGEVIWIKKKVYVPPITQA